MGWERRPGLGSRAGTESCLYLCVLGRGLVGFVNVAWDGGVHGFILDTTVHPRLRRRGIGRGLVLRAVAEARRRNVEWLHVGFELHLRNFYDLCGFRTTEAGLLCTLASKTLLPKPKETCRGVDTESV